ncbi:MAG: hypothetical protein SNJ76_08520 [Fimbriimonadaceae bacterium]
MKVTLLHTGWEFRETSASPLAPWLPAAVPGFVHLDLMRNGVIPDPHERMFERGVQWVDETDWTYRCRFEWHPTAALPHRALRFEGLDTVAKIGLNGSAIGASDNMFLPVEFDVASILRPGQNELTVEFASAARVGRERDAEFRRAEGLGDEVARFPERSYVRKVQCMFGWDWGPRLVSCGIWQPVRLLEFANRLIDTAVAVLPSVILPPNATAPIPKDVVPTLENKPWMVRVQSEIFGAGVPVHRLHHPDGTVEERRGDGEFWVQKPRLWWPHGHGEQPIYRIETVFDGQSKVRPIGFRTIRLLQIPDPNEPNGATFEFEVNGRRIYALGANWIPDDTFVTRTTPERLRAQIERAVAMNMNMLRVWGGGHYESDAFYDLCDEYGIMVWQDFAYACAYYPDREPHQEEARREAEHHVKRLANRPSLALWCGNNENLMLWHQSWGGWERRPPRYYGENIYDRVLPETVAKFSPNVAYVVSSPVGSNPITTPEGRWARGCNEGDRGDQHYWDVWHGRGDWTFYADSTARFASEFGFSASPSLSLWEKTIDPEIDWDPVGPVVRWHDKTGKTAAVYHGFVERHYPPIRTMEDLHYGSSLNQRDAIRFAVEHYRHGTRCRGTLIWQLNDCWPVQSWALIDSHGVIKPAGRELQRAYAPVLVSAAVGPDGRAFVRIANDSPDACSLDLELRAVSLSDGTVLASEAVSARIDSGGRAESGALDVSAFAAESTAVAVFDAGGLKAWKLLAEPKDVVLPPPGRLKVRSVGEGRYEVSGRGPVLDLFLHDPGSASLEPNWTTVLEAGDWAFEFAAERPLSRPTARSLAGEHELVLDV